MNRKISTQAKSTSNQLTSNRSTAPNKAQNQAKSQSNSVVNKANVKSNVTTSSNSNSNPNAKNAKSILGTKTALTNGKVDKSNVASKKTPSQSSLVKNKGSVNVQNSQRKLVTNEVKNKTKIKGTTLENTTTKTMTSNSMDKSNRNSTTTTTTTMIINDSSPVDGYNRELRKVSYNESTTVEPPSFSEREDVSDRILNENNEDDDSLAAREDDEYNYGSDEFESEYASDFEDASIDKSEVNEENEDEEYEEEDQNDEDHNDEDHNDEDHNDDYDDDHYDASEAANLSDDSRRKDELLTKESTQSTQRRTSPPTQSIASKSSNSNSNSNQLKPRLLNQRVLDLSEIIKLNTVDYNIYDNAPLNYDVFMQLFGRKNRRQVCIQSKDCVDQETQTEYIAVEEQSTAVADASCNAPGNASEVNPFALLAYLQKVSPKVMSLIEFESDCVKEGRNKLQIPAQCKQFCEKFYKLSDTRFAKMSTIDHIFCDAQFLFAVQNVSKLKGCTEESIISLWSSCNTISPESTLIARSHVQCLTRLNSVVIAGMIDGSVALWDLKESTHYHKEVTVEQVNYVLKSSSFSTAGTSLNLHLNRVVAVEKIPNLGSDTNTDQIATIDESGLLVVWLIVDTFQKEVSFSENAEGMMPGSRVRLTKVWTFSFFDKKSTDCVLAMKCKDESTFLVGLDTGLILKYSTFEPENRITYKPSGLELQLSPVTALCVHPSDSMFLVSYKAGYICLFSFETDDSTFFSPKNIVDPIDMYWFQVNSNFFVVFESTGFVSVFNSKDESGACVLKYGDQSSRYTCVAPFVTRDRDCLAFGTDSGTIEVMQLNRFDR